MMPEDPQATIGRQDPQSRADIRPDPDPTRLSTEQLLRTELTLRNLIINENAHLHELIDEKVDAVTKLLAERITGVNVLTAEKFVAVDDRFEALEKRTAEQKSDTNTSLTAALAAQEKSAAATTLASEKSIDKSEAATNRRIEGVENAQMTNLNTTDDKIVDIKDRIVAMENKQLGGVNALNDVRSHGGDNRSLAAIGISTLFLIISLIGMAVTFTHKTATPPATVVTPTQAVVAPAASCATAMSGQQCVTVKP